MSAAEVSPARVRPPTIRDVARAAGVSVGTASKALNGRGRLRTETRERVLAEAERLEFRPNDLIRSLQRGRTYTVGLVTTDYFGRFNMPLLAGIEDALGAAEILVFVCNIRDDPVRERKVIASLLAKQVDGLIVMGRRTDLRAPISVGRSDVPVVYAFTRVPDPKAVCLLPDDFGGARLAIEHLLRVGRRRLAYISGPADREAVELRRAGMAATLEEYGLTLPEELVKFLVDKANAGEMAKLNTWYLSPRASVMAVAAETGIAPFMKMYSDAGVINTRPFHEKFVEGVATVEDAASSYLSDQISLDDAVEQTKTRLAAL